MVRESACSVSVPKMDAMDWSAHAVSLIIRDCGNGVRRVEECLVTDIPRARAQVDAGLGGFLPIAKPIPDHVLDLAFAGLWCLPSDPPTEAYCRYVTDDVTEIVLWSVRGHSAKEP